MRFLVLTLSLLLCSHLSFAAGDKTDIPDATELEAKLAALNTESSPELARLYESILSELRLTHDAEETRSRYQKIIDNYADLSNQRAAEFTQLQKQKQAAAPKDDSKLELLISQKDAELVQEQSRLSALDQRITRINQRIPLIPQDIDKLKTEQRALRQQLSKAPAASTAKEGEAQQWLVIAKINRVAAAVQALEIEQLSSNNRLELYRLEREWVSLKQDQLNQQLNEWRERLSKQRRADTAELVEAAKQGAESQLQEQDPLLTEQAAKNEEWATHLTNLTELIEHTSSLRTQTAAASNELMQERSLLQEQLGLSDMGAALGERLLGQYESLNQVKPDTTLEERIAKARVWRFRYREQADLLKDRSGLIQSLLAEQKTLLTPAKRERLNKLLDTREQLVNQLTNLQEKYILELAKYQGEEKQRLANAEALRELISQHLLWVANAKPISFGWLISAIKSVPRFADQGIWIDIKLAAQSSPLKLSLFIAICLLTFLLHNTKRRYLQQEISGLAKPVGRVTQDDISYTLKALAWSFFAAAIYLLPLLGLAWLFHIPPWEHPHASAVGSSAQSTSYTLMVVLLIHHLCRPDGVLCCHFGRNVKVTSAFAKVIYQFGMAYIPIAAISSFSNHFSDPLINAGLGRMLFMVMCLLLIVMLQRVTYVYLQHVNFSSQQKKWFTLFRWTLICVPFAAFIASFSGYYYSGRVLLSLVADSLIISSGFWLIYLVAYRFMAIQERRVAYERAKAKRAELIAQREKEQNQEDTSVDKTIELEEYEVDVDQLKAQALRLIRTSLLLGLAFVLMAVWSDVLSALTWLDDIVAWQTQSGDVTVDITLKKMLTGAITLIMTFIIARNLPSLIELAILQRLTLEPGVGFAISTLTRYGATLIGLLWGFSIIGFEWSKLQWLVAALGVGLGFGLQEIFANMVSGLIILFERPIRPGDTVTIDNLSGTVSKIHIRATTIVDWDRKEIVIPNKTFITQQFINWSLSDGITRVVLKVGVAYGSDVDLVERLLRETTQECANVLDTPEPSVFFLGFGNSTLDFEVRVFTSELGQRLPVTHRMHQLINAKFNDHGVTIAFPQLDVHMFRGK
ncbi:mechanosensitive ion channel domain-containing protein [Corallincola spongiicola]|uniref:Mechanosensitive ion channel n=1 Tax=Corallincola spongiicola TaxID=2520508 RepID=A0ABY1WQJ1_9GAMM|nr:mechanosensitive ion channel domain-containing protein [Corallincola spongiicola]TAA46990.1 mechanosensitive ion channel [Corallincola spongiicola]